ncbi:urease accessory protein UreD [Streptomyces sp. NBC_01754]|uniref:urease accessory protein UreD n=1 Tax=Streptomyces sp. NBC_01754 TaxID=2975930 RepID=UPI002DDA8272|nr:urease accessory protein UreD [Streptomyces sp. NBC_01754]WSC91674.1 urease accessory protein UreD [Streptomyces sp. NBC_01754]
MAQEASARLVTEQASARDGSVRTRLRVLRSSWPLMLRATSLPGPGPLTGWVCRDAPAACVHLAAGAAGPLGGDRLRLEVDVRAGSSLMLGEVSPTLLLPGPHGEESHLDISIRVGAGATLAWRPELAITARGCRHVTDTRVVLEDGARLLLREEVLFGRQGERPGSYRQRLRVRTPGGPLHDQELGVGPAAAGWDGPAVTAGHRAAGALLLVDPGTRRTTDTALHSPDTALMTLSGHAVLFSALAHDTSALRRRLDHALGRLLTVPPEKPAVTTPEAVTVSS